MEEMRAELEAVPGRDGVGELTREEFEAAVKRMKNGKATVGMGLRQKYGKFRSD